MISLGISYGHADGYRLGKDMVVRYGKTWERRHGGSEGQEYLMYDVR